MFPFGFEFFTIIRIHLFGLSRQDAFATLHVFSSYMGLRLLVISPWRFCVASSASYAMQLTMKIAIWHNLPSGGAKRALHDQVVGLKARGHELEVWCPSSADPNYLP